MFGEVVVLVDARSALYRPAHKPPETLDRQATSFRKSAIKTRVSGGYNLHGVTTKFSVVCRLLPPRDVLPVAIARRQEIDIRQLHGGKSRSGEAATSAPRLSPPLVSLPMSGWTRPAGRTLPSGVYF